MMENLKSGSSDPERPEMPIVINQNRYSIFDRTVEENGLKRTTGILKKG